MPPFNYKHITVKSTEEEDKQLTLMQLMMFMECGNFFSRFICNDL